jgi:hypothetical protein
MAPIFHSPTRVSLQSWLSIIHFLSFASGFPYSVHPCLRIFYETPTMPHASCSCLTSHSLSGNTSVHLVCAIEWSHICRMLLLCMKNACGGCSTCQGFHMDVQCWGMTVGQTGNSTHHVRHRVLRTSPPNPK